MIYIIVEKKIEKKLKKTTYTVYHVTEYPDVLGNPVRFKQLAGTTTLEQIKTEMKEMTEKLEYRQHLLDEIANLDERKVMATDIKEVLAEMDRDKEKEKQAIA